MSSPRKSMAASYASRSKHLESQAQECWACNNRNLYVCEHGKGIRLDALDRRYFQHSDTHGYQVKTNPDSFEQGERGTSEEVEDDASYNDEDSRSEYSPSRESTSRRSTPYSNSQPPKRVAFVVQGQLDTVEEDEEEYEGSSSEESVTDVTARQEKAYIIAGEGAVRRSRRIQDAEKETDI